MKSFKQFVTESEKEILTPELSSGKGNTNKQVIDPKLATHKGKGSKGK